MKQQLLLTLENSQNYTLAVAEEMPETSYDFKPAGGGWNFAELMDHIAYGILWWEQNYVKGDETPWEQSLVKNNKQEIIDYLKTAYSSLKNTIEKQKLSDESVKGFHATIDHITHHRGQAVVYLRCKAIDPPAYTF
ncbi:MAG: DinB family protein [Chitinophagaceae bacterium]|nr:DinB family protein [Chitinophagaceae bacterium]